MRWGGSEFSVISVPLTPGEPQVPGAAELNRSRERLSLVLCLPAGLGAFRNCCKSKHEARSGCGEAQQPPGVPEPR